MSDPTQEQPAVETPALTTQPAGSGWSRIPDHLGRARTSTVVLAVLFVAIFALYLNVKPASPATTTSGTSNPAPVTTHAPAPRTTEAPSSAAPSTTRATPTPTQASPSSVVPTVPPTQVPQTTHSTAVPTPTPTPTTSGAVPAPTVSSPTP